MTHYANKYHKGALLA